MKTTIAILLISFTWVNSYSQKIRQHQGQIKSVNFENVSDISRIPSDSKSFFETYFERNDNVELSTIKGAYNRRKNTNETVQQFYKGIKIENARYSLHYFNDTLRYAHGNYVQIKNMDIVPTISPIQARNAFAKYKEISQDSIIDYNTELLIKEISGIPTLVYKTILDANLSYNDEVGYIDANTGNVITTKKRLVNISYTGEFHTKYHGIKQAKTMRNTGVLEYILKDDSRGATIHTKNMKNSYSTSGADEISDGNNIWTTAEFSVGDKDMGLDIHWALQEIYDYFYDNYEGINSFDNAGFDITAYIKYGTGDARDGAGWEDNSHYLVFGDGYTLSYPMASLDVIGHEYGHAISDLKVGMPYDENDITSVLQEGISDVWGVIIENAILPNDIWKLGEQIMRSHSCTRNIADPTDPLAYTQLITTCGSSGYNSSPDLYAKSGVMSYWFYLLVNGGSGTNALGNDYYLGGVGIEEASRFFTETIYSDYLTGNWSFEGMREAFTNSALFNGFGSYFKTQVEWAWYAVGVGNEPTQQSITGSYSVCNNGGTIYSIDNLLPGSTVQWTYSSNLISCGSGSDYIKLCQNGTGSGYVNATIHNDGIQTELPTRQVKVGVSGTLSGTDVIGYQGTGNYYVSSTCANNYQWYLKKEGQGGYILVQNSSSNSLALTSQTSGVRTYRIAPPPNTQTTFYLYAKVKDAYNGNTVRLSKNPSFSLLLK